MHYHGILALAVKVLRNCVSNVVVVSKLVAAHVDSALDVAAQEVLSTQTHLSMVFNLIPGQTFMHLLALCQRTVMSMQHHDVAVLEPVPPSRNCDTKQER